MELSVGQKLEPALFEQTGGQKTPPGDTPQPLCDTCGTACVLVVDKPPTVNKPSRYDAPLAGTGRPVESETKLKIPDEYTRDVSEDPPVQASQEKIVIKPIFELENGEQMIDVRTFGTGYLLVTTKRVLKLEV